jgi:trk system potassium uptake protein TrkA
MGAGRVGLRTARVLRESGHEVTLIEQNRAAIARARDAQFEVIEGDGALEETLEAADLDTVDALGALTGDLNDNFVACMIGKDHGCRTVMRIDEDYREEIYQRYASEVDEVIYPERLGAIAAKNALLGGNIRAVADIAQHLQLVEFTITDSAPMKGYSLDELELPSKSRLLAHGKGNTPLAVPEPDGTLELGDHLVILADFDTLSDVRSIVVGDSGSTAVLGGA